MSRLTILLVEDNPADVVLFREALMATALSARVDLAVIENGEDAILYLRRQGPFMQAPRPNVVVLDLNLPIKKGHEVLVEMAADRELRLIPVAILTTSTSEAHLPALYEDGLCKYFVKTEEFKQLQEIVRQIVAQANVPE